jgi:hypothetical protein
MTAPALTFTEANAEANYRALLRRAHEFGQGPMSCPTCRDGRPRECPTWLALNERWESADLAVTRFLDAQEMVS